MAKAVKKVTRKKMSKKQKSENNYKKQVIKIQFIKNI